jgi:MoaA/NifB/PqqE/SkfB family radical SAM enzyme
MDDALFESIIEQLSAHDVHLIQPFLNNDPLTDKKIVPRLRAIIAKNPRARVMITTNGALLRDSIVDALVELDLHAIHISSNALTAEVYRRTMGIDGYAVIRNVNHLWSRLQRARARTRLTVTAILLESNKREIAHMSAYWRSRGIGFYLNPLNDRAGNLSGEQFDRLLPFSDSANRTQLRSVNMSGCPSLYSFMGIHWNGDVIACCNDWRRARVMGSAREQDLHAIWHGEAYRAIRHLSDTGRLNEAPLCGDCGEKRFSVDTGALRNFLERQAAGDRGQNDADLEVVAMLERFGQQQPEILQLGLVNS